MRRAHDRRAGLARERRQQRSQTERIRLVEDGKFLEADITIEDPAVFIKPLQVTKRSRRVEASIIEWRCAAGEMGNPFADASDPIPVATKAEF